jgi:hypothetical protein
MPEQNEEVKDEVVEDQQEEIQSPDPIEEEARAHGWRPKEEFDADPKNEGKKWRDADSFMDRKSFFDKIEAISHENKTLKKGMQALGQHYENVEKTAYAKALAELKAQRRQALEDGEHAKAEDIRDQMDEVKQAMQNVKPVVQVDGPPAEFVEWKERNPWYKTDDPMTRYADSLGRDLSAEGKDPATVLKEVEKKVREAFPEKFRNPRRDSAPEMVQGGRKADTTKGFRLTPDEERILNTMIKGGAPITREQYIADLKAQRG